MYQLVKMCAVFSQELCELGVVSGADLTVEAALTKLSFLLGQTHLSVQDIREVCSCTLYM